MKPLAANLKHFYQCRGLWYFYATGGVFGACVLGGIVARGLAGKGYFAANLAITLFAGAMAADVISSLFDLYRGISSIKGLGAMTTPAA